MSIFGRARFLLASLLIGAAMVGFVFFLIKGQAAVAAPVTTEPMHAATNAADSCFVSLDDTGTLLFSSPDASALQKAVDNANPGDLLRVAGVCAGVQWRAGYTQTVYISKPLTVQGGYTTTDWTTADPDNYTTILSALQLGRVFYITGANGVDLWNLQVTQGYTDGDGGGAHIANSSVQINNTRFITNHAEDDGGAIYSTLSSLNIAASEIISNYAGDDAGGIASWVSATMTLSDSLVQDNQTGSYGGGLYSEDYSHLVVQDSQIIGNYAGSEAGGIASWSFARMTMTNSLVQGNWTDGDAGGLYNYDNSHMIVHNSQIIGNYALDDEGGGIINYSDAYLTVTASLIRDNWVNYWGGGIENYQADVYIADTQILSNSAVGDGVGGGLLNYDGNATLERTIIAGNEAVVGGGGIWVENDGHVILRNSTVSGNRVLTDSLDSSSGGGGIAVGTTYDDVAMEILYSTIASNTAPNLGVRAGIYITGDNHLTMTSSIVAYHSDGNCVVGPDATIVSGGYNLEDGNDCGLSAMGDLVNADPKLGPLEDNGGNTATHALLPGSDAIDHIPGAANGCGVEIVSDQRGFSRPFNNDCDIGAYELTWYTLTVNLDGNGSGVVNGPGINCGSDCDESYVSGSIVTVTASADLGSTFSGWSGACGGAGDCVVTMDSTKSVTATYTMDSYELYLPFINKHNATTPTKLETSGVLP